MMHKLTLPLASLSSYTRAPKIKNKSPKLYTHTLIIYIFKQQQLHCAYCRGYTYVRNMLFCDIIGGVKTEMGALTLRHEWL